MSTLTIPDSLALPVGALVSFPDGSKYVKRQDGSWSKQNRDGSLQTQSMPKLWGEVDAITLPIFEEA